VPNRKQTQNKKSIESDDEDSARKNTADDTELLKLHAKGQ